MQVIALLLVAAGGTLAHAQQPGYAQCGGIGWTGGTTCALGYMCVPQAGNPYYSQCLPVPNTTNAQPAYAQCGGINWTGGTTCVAGYTCVPQSGNPYYSQCLPVSASSTTFFSSTSITSSTTTKTSSTSNILSSSTSTRLLSSTKASRSTKTSSSIKASSSSSSATGTTSSKTASTSKTSTSTSASATAVSGGVTYKASFTHYGAGDSFGSPNCNTDTAACGFYTYPGYSAAVSQNLYGVGPGAGAGPACGTCWSLTGETDSSGNALSNAGTTIVVMVNNLCPAAGNPLCAQNGLSGTNQYGANVNFDLCSDSGASAAFFGNDGVGLAVGYATEVSCSQWSGTVVY